MRAACGIESEAIYHPPPQAGKFHAGTSQPYVFFPSRIEHAKRQDLVVRAMAHVKARGHMVFAGEGGQADAVRTLAAKLGVEDRVRFLGRVSRDEMIALYAHAAAVCFPPLDEDYGYVTLEAMLARKPVVTCSDSGGPLEFVVDGETGYVTAPEPEALGAALDRLLRSGAIAQRLGAAGRARYDQLVRGWAPVVDTLLAM
jgi:glycosyltransferase involved in cell wall biosynthesis